MVGFLLFSDALAPMDAVVKLLMNILSRKFEFEAGTFNPKITVTQNRANCFSRRFRPGSRILR